MLKWCPKYRINIEQDWKRHCPSCIFYRQKEDADDKIYLICDYENWNPGLIQEKNE